MNTDSTQADTKTLTELKEHLSADLFIASCREHVAAYEYIQRFKMFIDKRDELFKGRRPYAVDHDTVVTLLKEAVDLQEHDQVKSTGGEMVNADCYLQSVIEQLTEIVERRGKYAPNYYFRDKRRNRWLWFSGFWCIVSAVTFGLALGLTFLVTTLLLPVISFACCIVAREGVIRWLPVPGSIKKKKTIVSRHSLFWIPIGSAGLSQIPVLLVAFLMDDSSIVPFFPPLAYIGVFIYQAYKCFSELVVADQESDTELRSTMPKIHLANVNQYVFTSKLAVHERNRRIRAFLYCLSNFTDDSIPILSSLPGPSESSKPLSRSNPEYQAICETVFLAHKKQIDRLPTWLDHTTVRLMTRQLLLEEMVRYGPRSHSPPLENFITEFFEKVALINDTRAFYRRSASQVEHHYESEDFEIELAADEITSRSVAGVRERCKKVEDRIEKLKSIPMKITPSSHEKARADYRLYLAECGEGESEEDLHKEWVYICGKHGITVPIEELPPPPLQSISQDQLENVDVPREQQADETDRHIRVGNNPVGQPD